MDNNLNDRINVVIGLFVIACLASTFFYGCYSIVVCVIGLFVIAALLQLLGGGS